jgi:hypothetical protein
MAKNTSRIKKYLPKVLIVLLIIGLAASTVYFYKKYDDLKNNPVTADQAAQAEIDRYVAEVGKLYDLPKDEKPSVATVKDKELLKDQPFFAKAENGDITLIYSNAKLAILYRPSTGQLVNVSTVTISDGAKVTVVGEDILRGAAVASLANNQIKATDGGTTKGSYTGITVVDVSGQNEEQAKKIAETLNGKVGTLPEGEEKPADTDILVIVGKAQ